MVYNIIIRPLAREDIADAYNWYEGQQQGLGLAFLDALESFYSLLLLNPFTHSFYDEPVRQGMISRFPYLVVYEIVDDQILVYSVFMTSQHPGKKRTL